jgi:hypothetical protein
VRCEDCHHVFVAEGRAAAPPVAEDGIQDSPRRPPPAPPRPREPAPRPRPHKEQPAGRGASAGAVLAAVTLTAVAAFAAGAGAVWWTLSRPAAPDALPAAAPDPAPPKPAEQAKAGPKPPPGPDLNLALRYRWDGGGTHAYRVSIEADKGDFVETWEGHAIYTVRRDDDARFTITTRGGLESRRRTKQGGVQLPGLGLPGMPGFPGFHLPGGFEEREVRMSASGHLLKRCGGSPLPLALGDLTELVIDELPEDGALRRQADDSCVLSETGQGLFPGLPRGMPGLGPPGFPRGPLDPFDPFGMRPATVRAEVQTVCTRGAAAGDTATLHKRYEIKSEAPAGAAPRFRVLAEGPLTFAVKAGMPKALELKGELSETAGNIVARVPFTLTYRLLEGDERERVLNPPPPPKPPPPEPPKPLTEAELTKALAGLKSGDRAERREALDRLANAKPAERRAEVARAIEALLTGNDHFTGRSAAKALGVWGDKESVPVLLKLLDDDDVFVCRDVLAALGQLKDERAIEPIARRLKDFKYLHPAGEALRAMGGKAEKAVIPYLKDPEVFVRLEACRILEEIGTKDSEAALKEAADKDDFVEGPAKAALQAIAARRPPE